MVPQHHFSALLLDVIRRAFLTFRNKLRAGFNQIMNNYDAVDVEAYYHRGLRFETDGNLDQAIYKFSQAGLSMLVLFDRLI